MLFVDRLQECNWHSPLIIAVSHRFSATKAAIAYICYPGTYLNFRIVPVVGAFKTFLSHTRTLSYPPFNQHTIFPSRVPVSSVARSLEQQTRIWIVVRRANDIFAPFSTLTVFPTLAPRFSFCIFIPVWVERPWRQFRLFWAGRAFASG